MTRSALDSDLDLKIGILDNFSNEELISFMIQRCEWGIEASKRNLESFEEDLRHQSECVAEGYPDLFCSSLDSLTISIEKEKSILGRHEGFLLRLRYFDHDNESYQGFLENNAK